MSERFGEIRGSEREVRRIRAKDSALNAETPINRDSSLLDEALSCAERSDRLRPAVNKMSKIGENRGRLLASALFLLFFLAPSLAYYDRLGTGRAERYILPVRQ